MRTAPRLLSRGRLRLRRPLSRSFAQDLLGSRLALLLWGLEVLGWRHAVRPRWSHRVLLVHLVVLMRRVLLVGRCMVRHVLVLRMRMRVSLHVRMRVLDVHDLLRVVRDGRGGVVHHLRLRLARGAGLALSARSWRSAGRLRHVSAVRVSRARRGDLLGVRAGW